jgi:hypothetical protein
LPTFEGDHTVPDELVSGFGRTRFPVRSHQVCIDLYRKEGIMERSKPNFAVLGMLFFIGVSSLFRFSQNLFHFSQNVRIVDVVGLSGGGAACGAAMFGFIFRLIARNKV